MRDKCVEMRDNTNKMRDRLIKILHEMPREMMIGEAADYILANGVIVPPCKFLQRVYVIPTIENRLSDVTEMKCIGFTLSHDAYCVNLMNEKNKLYQPAFGRFGKTVFLTREEAERALKGASDYVLS